MNNHHIKEKEVGYFIKGIINLSIIREKGVGYFAYYQGKILLKKFYVILKKY